MKNIYKKIKISLSPEYENEYGKMRRFTKPKIYHGGDNYDMSKRWYVYFSFRNPQTGKLERQRPIYLKANHKDNTKADRLKFLKELQQEVYRLLKEGYSPYADQDTPKQELTAQEAIEYALQVKQSTLAVSSYRGYEYKVKDFFRFLKKHNLEGTNVKEIDKAIVVRYLNTVLKHTSARTRNNTKITLSSLFSVLEEEDIIERNFIISIKRLPSTPKRHKKYNEDQINEIFNYLAEKDLVLLRFIKFVSFNFLRPIEVCRLRVKDIDIKRKRLSVKAKNKPLKVKIIPDVLMDDVKAMLTDNPDDFLFTPSGVGEWAIDEMYRRDYFSNRFNRRVKKHFKLEKDYTIYSFRHTYTTKLYNEFIKIYPQGEALEKLRLITGHETIKALMMYLRDIDAILPEDYSEYLL